MDFLISEDDIIDASFWFDKFMCEEEISEPGSISESGGRMSEENYSMFLEAFCTKFNILKVPRKRMQKVKDFKEWNKSKSGFLNIMEFVDAWTREIKPIKAKYSRRRVVLVVMCCKNFYSRPKR